MVIWLSGSVMVWSNEVSTEMGDPLCEGEPSWYLTSYAGPLSLAIPLWDVISNNESWE